MILQNLWKYFWPLRFWLDLTKYINIHYFSIAQQINIPNQKIVRHTLTGSSIKYDHSTILIAYFTRWFLRKFVPLHFPLMICYVSSHKIFFYKLKINLQESIWSLLYLAATGSRNWILSESYLHHNVSWDGHAIHHFKQTI